MRGLLPPGILAAAERRAQTVGVGADRVLICADAITEESYLRALASALGTTYEPLDRVSRADCPLEDRELIQAAAAGLLPLRIGGRIVWIIAPRHLIPARRLADPRRPLPNWVQSFRLTSSERLWRFVARHAGHALGRQAAEGLAQSEPLLSSAPQPKLWKRLIGTGATILALILFAIVPVTIAAFGSLLCAIFLAAAALRLLSALYTPPNARRSKRIGDDKLPIYTIICALYREANAVEKLVRALRALDYPIEKLDVKFVLEADDNDTRAAVARLDLGPPFEIVVAPPIGPRTKPKALNVALPLVRGAYIAVYDAEDTPEPDQLRRAVAAFRQSDDRVACLQASLTIDNTADNWLVRMFTADYAGQFDVFLPGLTALRLPFPLGGSSNHFRTAALREAGAWDPYNVTEDADLGIRLHRLGYRATILASTTYEEAPARFVPWLKQRTRWYKGWMQTCRVHLRHPLRLVRELTVPGAIAFQLFLAGNVLAALVHPIFMAALCYTLATQTPQRAIAGIDGDAPLFIATLLAGYTSTVALDFVGLRRRGLLRHAWVLLLTPLHWFLLSLAAWRAAYQLVRDPQRWEKTEHGLARHSRAAEAMQRRSLGKNQRLVTERDSAAPKTITAAAIGPPMNGGRRALGPANATVRHIY